MLCEDADLSAEANWETVKLTYTSQQMPYLESDRTLNVWLPTRNIVEKVTDCEACACTQKSYTASLNGIMNPFLMRIS